ncbi:hypothetical protein HYPSUDRAFT_71787 [Hypholoma sublateritium FD-334 SS-4]|uniref:Uncharacterized protein n=1 Tax=Hypholoma sublateritium (strain FD-334 SS-4) TaxID=945553 RepID=A0A0D2P5Y7_HYPSF|nr:hypothetical protein HYPSUDRAFT_71787 [Hypholoma sublateritium FD-334 SS-4]
MTDLTVLVSPIPLYPAPRAPLPFGRRTPRPASRPIMVTLESEIGDDVADRPHTPTSATDSDFIARPNEPVRRSRSPRVVEPHLLSPPVNTWKSRPRHRPTRSQSAPPERRTPPEPTAVSEEGYAQPVPEGERIPFSFDTERLGFERRNPNRSFTAFARADRHAPTTRSGELVRPPPPLLRPTTFWRKTRRSGVTGPSYSPASHLIRRSTYIAAGLTFDSPVHDLSALCVESRVGFIVIPPVDQTLL